MVLIIKSGTARWHWGYLNVQSSIKWAGKLWKPLFCSLFLPSSFTYPCWCCWHFNRPVRLVAGGHWGKQEKNSLVQTFRMMSVNRIAMIYDVDWPLCGMLCSLAFRFRTSLSAISQKTSRCKRRLNTDLRYKNTVKSRRCVCQVTTTCSNDNFSKEGSFSKNKRCHLCDSVAGIFRRCLDCSATAKVCESCAISRQIRYFSSSGNP